MKRRNLLAFAALAMSALLLTGCSNVAEHTDTYFTQMKSVVTTAISASQAEKEAAATEGVTKAVNEKALAKPANFTVSEDGTYSFDAVENASYYLVYVYSDSSSVDAVATSAQIAEDGSASYTGSVNDITRFTYESWNIRVVAYPDYETTDYVASPAAKCDYVVSGEVAYGEPTFGYMWTVTSGELQIKVSDLYYGETAYPTDIKLTLTNTEDASDVVTVDITDVSGSSATGSTTAVTAGATYDIAADFTWDETYVTNPSYSIADGGEAVTSAEENTVSGEFSYSSAIFNSFDFPHVQENFDPEKGGSAGVWYNAGGGNNGGWGQQESTEETDSSCYFEATPTDANEGAKYSYDIEVTSPAGGITASPKLSPGSGSTKHIFGTLDIFEDGTFKMEIEYQYIKTDAMNAAVYYVPGVICEGVYSTNDDGTLNLSYDHENAYETDYDIVTELTGKAAAYAEEHPEEMTEEQFPASSGDSAGDSAGGEGQMPEGEGGAPAEVGAPAEDGAPAENGAPTEEGAPAGDGAPADAAPAAETESAAESETETASETETESETTK